MSFLGVLRPDYQFSVAIHTHNVVINDTLEIWCRYPNKPRYNDTLEIYMRVASEAVVTLISLSTQIMR